MASTSTNLHAVCALCGAIRPAILVWGVVIVGCECVRVFGPRVDMISIPGAKTVRVHIDHDPGDEHP